MIHKFNQYNESIRDKMSPKSEEEIDDVIKNLNPQELLMKAIFDLQDISLVKEALKRGADPSKDKNQILKDIILTWHYDEAILEILEGDVLGDAGPYLVDNWFIGHCLDDSEEVQKETMEFFTETLKLLLKNERVKDHLTALDVLGYRTILGVK